MDLVHHAGKPFVGFVGKRCGDNFFYAGPSSRLRQKTRINSVAGNDPERVWRLSISQQEITEVTEVLKFKPSVFSVSSC